MACDPQILKQVPLFALFDEDELCVLAAQVEVKKFAARQRIYKIGDPGGTAYVIVSGQVTVTMVDEDHQDVVLDTPASGDFCGFASMLDGTPHQTNATAVEEAVCLEVDRHDIETLLRQRPHAGMDMLSVIGRQFHSAQQLVRLRAARNPNVVIEEEATVGERIADAVASFGGSWSFIIVFAAVLIVYSGLNLLLGQRAWDPYPFILLNLFLSMLAAIQAPVIMMSQNRQDKKDRLRGELDYDVNRRAEQEIQSLAAKLNVIVDKIDDIHDDLRTSQSRT
jgi:CRP/FNR family transcriptional regulator, cyclic AMP receptor protein